MIRAILALLGGLSVLCIGPAGAQVRIDLERQTRNAAAKPLRTGAALPAACSEGELFFLTSAEEGRNIHVCTSGASWVAVSGLDYGAGTGILIAGTTIGLEDGIIPMYFTGQGAPTLPCVAGRDFYTDKSAGQLYFCESDNSWKTAGNVAHTHTAAEIASGVLAKELLPVEAARLDIDNVLAAGKRLSVEHDATAAGLRIKPSAGDPAGAVDGDVWFNSSEAKLKARVGGANLDLGGSGGGQPAVAGGLLGYRWAMVNAVAGSSTPSVFGTAQVSGGTVSNTTADANYGSRLNFTTAATTGSTSYSAESALGSWKAGRNLIFTTFAGMNSTTALRVQLGLTGAPVLSNMFGTDTPVPIHAAFRFSSQAGDANWKCVSNGGGTVTVADSGIPANTTPHWFWIEDDAGAVSYKVDGIEVCRITSNVPPAGTTMRWFLNAETLEDAAKTVSFGTITLRSAF